MIDVSKPKSSVHEKHERHENEFALPEQKTCRPHFVLFVSFVDMEFCKLK